LVAMKVTSLPPSRTVEPRWSFAVANASSSAGWREIK
jgi:hypothetical protein